MRRTGSVNRRQSTIAWEGCSGQKRRGQQNKTQHEGNKRLNNQKKTCKIKQQSVGFVSHPVESDRAGGLSQEASQFPNGGDQSRRGGGGGGGGGGRAVESGNYCLHRISMEFSGHK